MAAAAAVAQEVVDEVQEKGLRLSRRLLASKVLKKGSKCLCLVVHRRRGCRQSRRG